MNVFLFPLKIIVFRDKYFLSNRHEKLHVKIDHVSFEKVDLSNLPTYHDDI